MLGVCATLKIYFSSARATGWNTTGELVYALKGYICLLPQK
jgi:hypothetical protein